MSGFEIAGIILGAIPILFKAVDIGRDGWKRLGLNRHEGKILKALAQVILVSKLTLQNAIIQVLTEIGAADDIGQLSQDPYQYLSHLDTHEKLGDCLGQEFSALFHSIIVDIHDELTEVAHKINMTVQGHTENPDFLLKIVQADEKASTVRWTLGTKIKLAFSINAFEQTTQELERKTTALDRLTSKSISIQRSLADLTSVKGKELSKAFRHLRKLTVTLSDALHQVWGGDCHDTHRVLLLLEDRVDIAIKCFKRSSSLAYNALPILNFQLIFAAEGIPGKNLWHRNSVSIFNNQFPKEIHSSELCRENQRPAVSFANTGVEMSSLRPRIDAINDLCAHIEQMIESQQYLRFGLVKSDQLGAIIEGQRFQNNEPKMEVKSLKTLLLESRSNPDLPTLSLKARMMVALQIASNTLQLLRTRWMNTTWSKEMVMLEVQMIATAAQPVVNHQQPFISLNITSTSDASEPADIPPKIVLLELGIVLLELYYNTTIEARFGLESLSNDYQTRFSHAASWLNDSDLLPLYDIAVSNCVWKPPGETRSEHWDDDEFWIRVCTRIIEPLSKNCDRQDIEAVQNLMVTSY